MIPTIWCNAPHSVVLTEIGNNRVFYNDPNVGPANTERENFLGLWRRNETDNDLLIVSKERIPKEVFVGLVDRYLVM